DLMTLRTFSRSCGLLAALSFLGFAACSAPATPEGPGGGNGNGAGTGDGDSAGDGDIGGIGDGDIGGIGAGDLGGDGDGPTGDECGAKLPVVFRDFKGSGEVGGHPDFELSATVKEPDGVKPYRGWNDAGCG